MSDRFPTFSPSDQGSIADLHTVWEQRALTWANYKGQFDKKLKACTPYVTIDGKLCYGHSFFYDYHALASPWDSTHPHVEYLRILGMTDDDIRELWVTNIDPPEVDKLWNKWKNPDVGRTQSMGEQYYAEIYTALTEVTSITLTGETVVYNSGDVSKPEVAVDALNGHSSSAVHINQTSFGELGDYDLYNEFKPYPIVLTPMTAKDEWLDTLLAVKLLDRVTDVTPVDAPLLDAIRALILLEGDSFAPRTAVTKISERVVGDVTYVTTEMTYDTSTLTEFYNIDKFLHTDTEYYDKVISDDYIPVVEIQEIWKNYFWKYREPDSDEEDLAIQSDGILLLKNGVIYLTVDGLFRSSDKQFKEIIAPAINIYSELKDLARWKKILIPIAEMLNNLYGGIYNLLKHIPYFKHKEEQLIDWLVKHGKPFSSKEFTREEAEVYMKKVGTSAIGITISIVLLFLTAGATGAVSAAGKTIISIASAIGLTPALLASMINALLTALNIGLQAYTSYIGTESDFENYLLDEEFKEQTELEEKAKDEAKDAVEVANAGTMGDIDTYELQNYILYHGIFNEKFDDQLEHLNPFDRDGEFKPKYKQGG